MSTAQFTIPLITVIPGQLITASLWNNEFNNLDTNLNPDGIGAYSDTDTQMQTTTDPYPASATSRPSSMSGEIQRLRFVIVGVTGKTYWYQPPIQTLAQLDSRATTLEGKFPVATADIAALAVTDAKINDVASSKITGTITPSDGTVTTAKLVALAVTDAKINDVATTKLTGTISTSQIGDAQVSYAKLASDVTTKLSPKSIQRTSITLTLPTTGGRVSGTVTIASVDTAKSFISLNGIEQGGLGTINADAINAKAVLASATSVSVSISGPNNAGGPVQFTVFFEVVEWN